MAFLRGRGLLQRLDPDFEAVDGGIAVEDLAGEDPVGGGGAGLFQVLAALAHAAAATGGKRDDGLAREVILLQEGVDDPGCGVPPDGETHIDGRVLGHVLHLAGDGGTGGAVLHLDGRTALLIAPVEVLDAINLLGDDLKQVGIGGFGKRLGDLGSDMLGTGREIGDEGGLLALIIS